MCILVDRLFSVSQVFIQFTMWGLEAKKAHPLGGPSALSSPLLVAAPLGVIPTVRTP